MNTSTAFHKKRMPDGVDFSPVASEVAQLCAVRHLVDAVVGFWPEAEFAELTVDVRIGASLGSIGLNNLKRFNCRRFAGFGPDQ